MKKFSIVLKSKNQGFALVATLSLMLLLSLLAVTMMQIASVELRVSTATRAQSVARNNARLALMLAVAQLQKLLGPDQRVTARADILEVNEPGLAKQQPYWVGVWKTTDKDDLPFVRQEQGKPYLIDTRATNQGWRKDTRLGWLASGEDPSPDKIQDPVDMFKAPKGSTGANQTVQAELVKVQDSGGKEGGRLAYWVSDESLKARLNLPNKHKESNQKGSEFYKFMIAQNSNLELTKDGNYSGYERLSSKDLEKVTSYNQAALLPLGGDPKARAESLKRNWHDFTAYSRGLLVNVKEGGLQKDLTAFCESGKDGLTGGSDNEQKLLPNAPLSVSNPITGPKFNHLKSWYRLRDRKGIDKGAVESVLPKFRVLSIPATGIKTLKTSWEGLRMSPTNSSLSEDMNTNFSLLHPVMVDCRLQWDFSVGNGGGLKVHLYPRVTIWNPYNIDIEDKNGYAVLCSLPNLNYSNGIATFGGKLPVGSGKWFDNLSQIAFYVEPTKIPAGMALVFTPSLSSGASLGPDSVKYNLSDVKGNVLTAKSFSEKANFYFESQKSVDPTVSLPCEYDSGGNGSMIQDGISFQLKALLAVSSFEIKDLSSEASSSFPTINSMSYNYNSWSLHNLWWLAFQKAQVAYNQHPELLTNFENGALPPPTIWSLEGRYRWFNEEDGKDVDSKGGWAGTNRKAGTAGSWFDAASISSFNMRGCNIFRSPFCFYHDWPATSPGQLMHPYCPPGSNDSDNKPAYFNGYYIGSPFGLAGEWSTSMGIKKYVLFDVPRKEVGVVSLGSFQHASLSNYAWSSSYVVGQSLADMRSDRDKTVNSNFVKKSPPWGYDLKRSGTPNWDALIQQSKSNNECVIFDMAYEANNALWDRYFLSTISHTSSSEEAQATVSWNTIETLPNGRLVLNSSSGASSSEIESKLNDAEFLYNFAGWFLSNEGSFNVNSTSVDAWKGFLASSRNMPRKALDSTEVDSKDKACFYRLLVPVSSTSTTSTSMNSAAWSGVRGLNDDELGRFAEQIVEEVKLRGPFLGLSDFVNRRLALPEGSRASDLVTRDVSLRGPLQAAIERSRVNENLQSSLSMGAKTVSRIKAPLGGGMQSPDLDASPEWKTYGIPSYLTQGDVLTGIGPSLTSRGDTFVVRAYGDSRDKNGKILARAYCEAVVQRTPNFVEHRNPSESAAGKGNTPDTAVLVEKDRNSNLQGLQINSNLRGLNKNFGRKFEMVSFRWLAKEEV